MEVGLLGQCGTYVLLRVVEVFKEGQDRAQILPHNMVALIVLV